jgi:hypothetical protein
MENKNLLVMVKDGRVHLAIELGAFTINVPQVSFQVPRLGNDVHVYQNAGKVPFVRLIGPAIFVVAGLLTVIALWRLFH